MNRSSLLVPLAAVPLLAAPLALSACSSGSGSTDPSSPAVSASPPSTGATSPAASTSPTTPASSAATTSTPAGTTTVAQCAESQLRASIPANGRNSASGHLGVTVDFANTSGSTCSLQGYPGAAVVTSSGRQVVQATRTLRGYLGGLPQGVSVPPTVTLAPGAVAAAVIEGVDTQEPGAAQAGCDAAPNPRILVTPPNTTIPVPFDVAWPQCESFEIHPVQSTGS